MLTVNNNVYIIVIYVAITVNYCKYILLYSTELVSLCTLDITLVTLVYYNQEKRRAIL